MIESSLLLLGKPSGKPSVVTTKPLLNTARTHLMNVHFLQDSIKHQSPVVHGTFIGRSAKRGYRRSYNTTPVKGFRKYWKQQSKVIGNPHMKHAGTGIIWTTV